MKISRRGLFKLGSAALLMPLLKWIPKKEISYTGSLSSVFKESKGTIKFWHGPIDKSEWLRRCEQMRQVRIADFLNQFPCKIEPRIQYKSECDLHPPTIFLL